MTDPPRSIPVSILSFGHRRRRRHSPARAPETQKRTRLTDLRSCWRSSARSVCAADCTEGERTRHPVPARLEMQPKREMAPWVPSEPTDRRETWIELRCEGRRLLPSEDRRYGSRKQGIQQPVGQVMHLAQSGDIPKLGYAHGQRHIRQTTLRRIQGVDGVSVRCVRRQSVDRVRGQA